MSDPDFEIDDSDSDFESLVESDSDFESLEEIDSDFESVEEISELPSHSSIDIETPRRARDRSISVKSKLRYSNSNKVNVKPLLQNSLPDSKKKKMISKRNLKQKKKTMKKSTTPRKSQAKTFLQLLPWKNPEYSRQMGKYIKTLPASYRSLSAPPPVVKYRKICPFSGFFVEYSTFAHSTYFPYLK